MKPKVSSMERVTKWRLFSLIDVEKKGQDSNLKNQDESRLLLLTLKI